MKQSILILLLAVTLFSCGNSDQGTATEKAKEIQSAVKQNRPGSIATTADGYTMKAKIDGKEWVAASMMPPDAAGRIIGYYDKEYIGLPYNKTYWTVGKKITIGEDEAVDVFISNGCSWTDTKGEMEITKVDGNAAEGKFFFTAACNSTNKTVDVTDGFFRILLK
jgi:hypothetical protein